MNIDSVPKCIGKYKLWNQFHLNVILLYYLLDLQDNVEALFVNLVIFVFAVLDSYAHNLYKNRYGIIQKKKKTK